VGYKPFSISVPVNKNSSVDINKLMLYFLNSGVCLVEKDSGRNTAAIGGPNSNGSRDHGLFQINDRFWCNNSNTPGKDCNVTCARKFIYLFIY
jgi:hypothetical protein